MRSLRLRHEPPTVIVAALTVWLAAVATASATPILPSPLTIELSNPFQHGDAGDVLTFSGVLTNTTADTLYIEGWGLGAPGNISGYPVQFSFTPEWYAWPKTVAFAPFEATPLMPLFAAAIASDFSESLRILGNFAVAAYPIGAIIRNPDGSLVYDNAYGSFTLEIGEPPFPSPVPEPSTLLLTALGGLAMMRYRRRAHKGLNCTQR